MMTWDDLVKEFFPDASKKEREFILWEKTAFPVCGLDEVKRQLQEFKENR